MEPIINPWIIYAMGVAQGIFAVSLFTAIIGAVALFLFPMMADTVGVSRETILKYEKIIGVVTIIAALLAIFVPSKNTMLTMLVLQYTTPDNISLVQNNIVDFIQKIAEAVKGVK